jgi:hypothetical protein
MKHKVLIVSFFFPPANSIGAVRVGKMAKYLPDFGWEPIVLTVDKIRATPQTLPLEVDKTQINRTPYSTFYDDITEHFNRGKTISERNANQQTVKINKPASFATKCLRLAEPIYMLPVVKSFLFDPMGWYRSAVEKGLQIINNQNIDIIYSSFGPTISHLVASKLCKQTNIPWVAEFRDLWSINENNSKRQPFQYFEKLWEIRTLRNSKCLIAVSKIMANQLEKMHNKHTEVICNGFDEDDYKDRIPLNPKFSITYTGTIYPGKRDPTPLFQALGEAKKEDIITSEDIGVFFYGDNLIQNISSAAKKCDIENMVKIYDSVPIKESIIAQKKSTILLLLAWNDPRDAGTLTGKIFEYIGAGRPILAIAFKGGEIDNLLKETGCGIVINEASEIKSVLIKWLNEYKTKGEITTFYNPKQEVIKKYTRREQAREVAQLIDNILPNVN